MAYFIFFKEQFKTYLWLLLISYFFCERLVGVRSLQRKSSLIKLSIHLDALNNSQALFVLSLLLKFTIWFIIRFLSLY